jgi:hypothetical protein
MKVAIQIIMQNQKEFIVDMRKAVREASNDIFWGLDRCTDGSEELLRELGETNIIVNSEGEGFLAGKMRDMVLDEILKSDYDVVIMFDGDRIPIGLTREAIISEMNNFDVSVMLTDDKEIPDIRFTDDSVKRGERARSIQNLATAGVMIKRKFIDRVRTIKFLKNRCFFAEFDGTWGCEDVVFGACLYTKGAIVGFSNIIISGTLFYPNFSEQRKTDPSLIKQYEIHDRIFNYLHIPGYSR